jgi:prepilin-type N-terminal cleavage/methylation domain-containing protein
MKQHTKKSGFTLVELMVALLVSSVVLSAVATLAYATSSAKVATDEMGRNQAQLQQVSIRLGDLIKQSNRIISSDDWGLTLWQDRNGNGISERGEFVVIFRCYYYDSTTGAYKNGVGVRSLTQSEAIAGHSFGWSCGFRIYNDANANLIQDSGESIVFEYSILGYTGADSGTELYRQCNNPVFAYQQWDGTPRTAVIRFDTVDNGQTLSHTLNAHLRAYSH